MHQGKGTELQDKTLKGWKAKEPAWLVEPRRHTHSGPPTPTNCQVANSNSSPPCGPSPRSWPPPGPYKCGSKIGTQNGLPRQIDTSTKTRGPFPGGVILTHTQLTLPVGLQKEWLLKKGPTCCLVRCLCMGLQEKSKHGHVSKSRTPSEHPNPH